MEHKTKQETTTRTLMRAKTAIEYFGVSRSKFYSWLYANDFPRYQPDGKVLFVVKEEVQQFIETGKPVAAQKA